MEASFWHDKWERGEIAFHEAEPNPLLVKVFSQLGLGPSSRLFVPLCGKSLDMLWLHGLGHRVVGVELSEIAVASLFEELAMTPTISSQAGLKHYSAERLEVWVGDFFALTEARLGEVDAVYDRGALVALPQELRTAYAAHLVSITRARPQLLVTLEYDPLQLQGPPFLVTPEEILGHYGRAQRLERRQIPGGLKGQVEAWESLWRVEPLQPLI